ncbi:MAG: polymerase subunit epsilon, partial [Microbacterium sp.]|nr:polymerase subunit epsilon [Microbacterium sp.]
PPIYGDPMTLWQAEPLPLFQAPEWTRLVGVFDLETTGVDVENDRIVTAHVGVLDADGHVVDARDWLADPGVEIPDGAAAIHGITTDRARAEGAPAPRVVSEVVEALSALFAAGIPVVAYNAPFDFSMLKHEAVRHGVAPIGRRGAPRPRSRRQIRPVAARHSRRAAHAPDLLGSRSSGQPHRVLRQDRTPGCHGSSTRRGVADPLRVGGPDRAVSPDSALPVNVGDHR